LSWYLRTHSAFSLFFASNSTTRSKGDDPEEDQQKESKSGKLVVPWQGLDYAHTCPHCNTKILFDRATRATKVITTRDPINNGKKYFRDRDMLCMHCSKLFLAREFMQKQSVS